MNEDIVDTSEFILDENHNIQLVASEPQVILPVAMVEDEKNRFWVVEMPGYMRDINGSDEELPDGRIVILSDEDGDGKMDKRKVFLDNLLNPRAICLVYGGILYTDGRQLKWAELVDDNPQNTMIVDSIYVVGGNIEHQPNGLIYNLDNWIYSAKSNARYRKIDGEWIKEATTFRGQWGISMDRLGRLIYNHNSAPLIGDFSIPNQTLGNPFLNLEHSTGHYLTDDMRLFPIQATSVNRGYLPEVLDSTGKVIHYTSACSPLLFYGDKLDSKFENTAFVCAPEANLIANYMYDEDAHKAERSLGQNEFLVSKDETFRPVNLMTGLDGSLYILDMRKGIIQHSAYMSSYLRDAILDKGLQKVNGKGRIYKISKKDEEHTPKDLTDLTANQLMSLFVDTNLKVRMFAQKELIERNKEGDIKELYSLALHSDNINMKIHAIWTLEGMSALDKDYILALSKSSNHPDVLSQLTILSKKFFKDDSDFIKMYNKCFLVKSRLLDFLLASVVGQSSNTEHLWFDLAKRYPNDPIISEALVSSIADRETYFLNKIMNSSNEILRETINATLINKSTGEVQGPILITKSFDDDRTNGLKKFKTYCASCHGMDGRGQKNMAPSFKNSTIIQGNESKIATIILNGYDTGQGNYEIMMPAYKEDPNMTDQDIYDIISYLKSTFTDGWSQIKLEEIKELRQKAQ